MYRKYLLIIILVGLTGIACNLTAEPVRPGNTPESVVLVQDDPTPLPSAEPALFPELTATPPITSTPLVLPTNTSPPTEIPFQEPAGCMKPPDDYSRVQIGNAVLNARTYWMLERAQELYGGTIPITGAGITQGSYNPGAVAASFGTHDGGGAVDLTVRNIPYDYSIKWEDIPRLIEALRLSGFAAWYRDDREALVPHIHAIAIGDAELSSVAAEQLTGRYGYFRGYDGYPRDNGIPLTARYGSVVICQWMLDMGYRDMRGEPLPTE